MEQVHTAHLQSRHLAKSGPDQPARSHPTSAGNQPGNALMEDRVKLDDSKMRLFYDFYV
jgi:hypothetical protein